MKEKETCNTSSQLRAGKKSTLVIIYIILIICSLCVLVPLGWLVSSSLKTYAELTADPWGLPKAFHFENYISAWKSSKIYRYLLNSLFVTVLSIVVTVVTCTPLAFILSRYKFKVNRYLYYLVIAGMMVPIHSVIIPIYMMAGNLNVNNSLWYISFIYGAFRIPFTVFILESFMENIPHEMEESAFIDGCSIWKMFCHIILPLSRDGVVTISILTWLSSWNELLVSMLLLSKQELKTLPIGLMGFIDEYGSDYAQLSAGIVIAIAPSIILFAIAQKRIEKGLTAGSVKG
ncbi:carbohydrate ABC transporter permease [Hungatella sp.]|uniref:carbohydrate ABC transporter permease n=1 Tax=Hungatella sp. TaxID=2613924 RepID=UPI002A831D1D|nr:carbohydrate ABC transporter permease [Hungatella sp.]